MADEGYKRKRTAILSANAAAGYNCLMPEDETATVKAVSMGIE